MASVDDWAAAVDEQEAKSAPTPTAPSALAADRLFKQISNLQINYENKPLPKSDTGSTSVTSPTTVPTPVSPKVTLPAPILVTATTTDPVVPKPGPPTPVLAQATGPVPILGTGATAAAAAAASTAASPSVPIQVSNVGGDGDASQTAAVQASEASLLQKLLHSKLVTNKNDLEISRKDPKSPLHSVKSFDALRLKPQLLKGVYAMGYDAPSKIQETALPTLLADPPVNMIAQSQSGTGKTAAFVLTMLSRVDISKRYAQCLCLAPTYELALQIGTVVEEMGKFLEGLHIIYAVRGERVAARQLLSDHIVIGTPGTVLDWIVKFKVLDCKKLNVFVLDEADVMIATQGHQDQSIRIKKQMRRDCQILLFSATYDPEVMKFAQVVVPDPVTIRLRREEESLDNIKQFYISCSCPEDKYEALSNIYGTISIGQSMIFCQTRRTTSWLSEKMFKEGHAVGLLSGELAIEQRAAVIKRFRDGKEKVLITTNVSARGIDVEQVTVVVNFDLPVTMEGKPDFETYLHRIGRTGRFGKAGLAINFVDGNRSFQILKEIERHFGRPIEPLNADDVEAIERIGT